MWLCEMYSFMRLFDKRFCTRSNQQTHAVPDAYFHLCIYNLSIVIFGGFVAYVL